MLKPTQDRGGQCPQFRREGYSPGVWTAVGVEVRGDWVTLCQSDSDVEGPQRESNSELREGVGVTNRVRVLQRTSV